MFTPRNRISNFHYIALLCVSFVIDLISLIPFVGWGGAILYWIIFPVWFRFLQIPLMRAKNIGKLGITTLIEIIPFISILPGYTVSTWLVIRSVRKEDKQFNASQIVTMKTQAQEQAKEEAILQYQRYMEQKMVDNQ